MNNAEAGQLIAGERARIEAALAAERTMEEQAALEAGTRWLTRWVWEADGDAFRAMRSVSHRRV